jgi:hypothetical protein
MYTMHLLNCNSEVNYGGYEPLSFEISPLTFNRKHPILFPECTSGHDVATDLLIMKDGDCYIYTPVNPPPISERVQPLFAKNQLKFRKDF